jgi:hypothetical protein
VSIANSVSLPIVLTASSINSPQLEKIKVEINRLPDTTFKMCMGLHEIIESQRTVMKGFQFKAKNNEPIPPRIFLEQDESMRRKGTKVLHAHHKVLSQVRSL